MVITPFCTGGSGGMLKSEMSRGVDGRRDIGRGEFRDELVMGVGGASLGVDKNADRTGFTL